MRIGDERAKGYEWEDFKEAFRRYVPRAEIESFKEELREQTKGSDRGQTVETYVDISSFIRFPVALDRCRLWAASATMQICPGAFRLAQVQSFSNSHGHSFANEDVLFRGSRLPINGNLTGTGAGLKYDVFQIPVFSENTLSDPATGQT